MAREVCWGVKWNDMKTMKISDILFLILQCIIIPNGFSFYIILYLIVFKR